MSFQYIDDLHPRPQRNSSTSNSDEGKIFIKNLNKGIDTNLMYNTFAAFGNIQNCKIALDENKISKGYGFIQYESKEAAQHAIAETNGMLFFGVKIYVGHFIPYKEKEKYLRGELFTDIFVKNFGNITEEGLKDIFSMYGYITSCTIPKNIDGSSKGFGFVSFQHVWEAQKAVQELHNKCINGTTLCVQRAQNKTKQKNSYYCHQGTNLFIRNLDDEVDENSLRTGFMYYGTVVSAKVIREDGRSTGVGFVCFSTAEEATKAAVQMHGTLLGNKPLYITIAQRKEDRIAYLGSLPRRFGIKPIIFPPTPPTVPVDSRPRFYNPVNPNTGTLTAQQDSRPRFYNPVNPNTGTLTAQQDSRPRFYNPVNLNPGTLTVSQDYRPKLYNPNTGILTVPHDSRPRLYNPANLNTGTPRVLEDCRLRFYNPVNPNTGTMTAEQDSRTRFYNPVNPNTGNLIVPLHYRPRLYNPTNHNTGTLTVPHDSGPRLYNPANLNVGILRDLQDRRHRFYNPVNPNAGTLTAQQDCRLRFYHLVNLNTGTLTVPQGSKPKIYPPVNPNTGPSTHPHWLAFSTSNFQATCSHLPKMK